MSITVHETHASRRGSESSRELVYFAWGSDDDAAVRTAVLGTAPATYDGLSREECSLEPLENGAWEASVSYTSPNSVAPEANSGNYQSKYSVTAGTQHITQSLATVHAYSESEEEYPPPNFHGAIGVDKDSINGCDILVPTMEWEETHAISDDLVDGAYVRTLMDFTGTVNGSSFRDFSAGEVLFMGASGQQRSDGLTWDVTFKFAFSGNRTGITVGLISGIAKKGWEYMWVYYVDSPDPVEGVIPKIPRYVYVEKVYRDSPASFETLFPPGLS